MKVSEFDQLLADARAIQRRYHRRLQAIRADQRLTLQGKAQRQAEADVVRRSAVARLQFEAEELTRRDHAQTVEAVGKAKKAAWAKEKALDSVPSVVVQMRTAQLRSVEDAEQMRRLVDAASEGEETLVMAYLAKLMITERENGGHPLPGGFQLSAELDGVLIDADLREAERNLKEIDELRRRFEELDQLAYAQQQADRFGLNVRDYAAFKGEEPGGLTAQQMQVEERERQLEDQRLERERHRIELAAREQRGELYSPEELAALQRSRA